MSKIFNKHDDVPTAKVDKEGNLITSTSALKQLYNDVFKERLRDREIKEDFNDISEMKMKMWKQNLTILRERNSRDWTMNDLEKAISRLKNNKSKDPNEMINELFMNEYVGTDH